MFGRLLDWYTIYTFLGALAALRNFASCKIYFASKSFVLLHWQRMDGARVVGVSQTVTLYKEWNYGTFLENATYIRFGGHHVGHRPTFYTVSQKSSHLLTVCNFVES